jgi:signal transduction histidine kinase
MQTPPPWHPFLDRLPLRTRVLLSSLIGLLLVGLMTAAFVLEAQSQNALLTRVAERDLAAFDRYFAIFTDVSEQHMALHSLLSKAPQMKEEQLYELSKERLDAIHKGVRELEKVSDDLAASKADSTPEVRRNHDVLLRCTQDYQRTVASAVEIATVDRRFAADRLNIANEKFVVMNKAFSDLLKAQGAKTTEEIANRVHDSRVDTTLIALVTGLVAAALLFGLSLHLSRLISNSIEAEIKAMTETEKMKALGTLVSGVAHEVNTPVGVAVTAASSLHDDVARLRDIYTRGTMRKSDLEDFVKHADEAGTVLLRNLERASDLIQSFKQVAVDQSSEAKRRINMRQYLHEILTSLDPYLKRTAIRYRIDCADAIEIDCYPGALAQIVTNLVMNAVMHAYGTGQAGQLVMAVETMRDRVRLTFRDDGKGIPQEIIGKIFDPFFTTRRGSGGSGLGLHIVYNLVTQQLDGTIRCESEIGKGTIFVIEWPLIATH